MHDVGVVRVPPEVVRAPADVLVSLHSDAVDGVVGVEEVELGLQLRVVVGGGLGTAAVWKCEVDHGSIIVTLRHAEAY